MGSQEDIGRMLESKKSIVKRVCIEATKAHKSSNKPFTVKDCDSEVIFRFPCSWAVNDWYNHGPFGEIEIDIKLFPSLRSISVDKPAKVNQAFQEQFQSLVKELQKKVDAVRHKKQIVFTGYSSGGPIAVLATIWLLEDLAKSKAQILSPPPICITLGSPLIGCHIFSHALRRENWARHFVHVAARHDIIPRLFFAPFKCVEPHLARALKVIAQKPNKKVSGPALDVDKLFFDVLSSASEVTSHAACKLMEGTNLLVETFSGFSELSPYRPFGTHVFLEDDDEDGVKLVWLDNSEATLQLLFYSIQSESEDDAQTIARKGFVDHSQYKALLERIGEKKFFTRPGSDEEILTGVLIDAAEKFGLCPRGRLCLLAAGESEKQKTRNLRKADSKVDDIERALEAEEKYKRTCEHGGVEYFDSFKLMKSEEDFKANVKRLELAGVWDEIIEMLKSYKLPDQFEVSKKWIELGTRFRCLIEPLDVANYYRHKKNEDTGPYMAKGRPERYRFTQRWLEHSLRAKEGSCGVSCFWAEIEELSISLKSGASDFAEKASKLQTNVLQWNESPERGIFLKKIEELELVHRRGG